MSSDEILDVVIVGYGPTGQMAAALLGRRGHKVTAIERHHSLYSLPRASGIDFEIARILQSIGVMDRYLEESAEPASKYTWINGSGEHLMTIDWDRPEVNGFQNMYIGFQPRLEDCINDAALASGNVDVFHGWDVTEITRNADGTSTISAAKTQRDDAGRRQRTGEVMHVTAKYVIAADGGNSTIRSALGIELEDWGFDSSWLVVDSKIKRKLPTTSRVLGAKAVKFDQELIQVCDPARPLYFGPLGKGGRRFEFALMPGETVDQMESPDAAWSLLGDLWGLGPDDIEIYRQIVYTFNSFMAKEWRREDVFLIGDAAHAMPPYLAQGLCSSIRDAANLSWKLDFVLRGVAPKELLDTYQTERSTNARWYIEASLAVGAVSCTFDPVVAAERDAAFAAGLVEPPNDAPGLEVGVIQRGADGEAARPAGLQGPQAVVRYHGLTGRLDDVAPSTSFVVLTHGFDAISALTADQLKFLERIDAQIVQIGASDVTDSAIAADVTGAYGTYFAQHNLSALIVRPDFYVFGGATASNDFGALVDDLSNQLEHAAASITA